MIEDAERLLREIHSLQSRGEPADHLRPDLEQAARMLTPQEKALMLALATSLNEDRRQ